METVCITDDIPSTYQYKLYQVKGVGIQYNILGMFCSVPESAYYTCTETGMDSLHKNAYIQYVISTMFLENHIHYFHTTATSFNIAR